MSIPATMKFIVRGKSVDFKNREGSSPSIPKMKLEKCKFLIILKNFVNSFIFSFKNKLLK